MVFYPENVKGSLGEVWHGTKMLQDVPDHILIPMIHHNGSTYYVGELVKCTSSCWFSPKCWVWCNGTMHAVGYQVINTVVTYRKLYMRPGLILLHRQA